MIKPNLVGDEMVIEGEVEEGDNYPGKCCEGHDWEVLLVSPDSNPNWVSVWGVCPNHDDDMYGGVTNILVEDLAEMMINGTVIV